MTMSTSTKDRIEGEEWSPESEIQLFLALEGLKPVGINKYFFMACISERLSKALNREIGTDAIWSHLKTMYNLAALDDLEPLPFPNDPKEFALPEAEFSSFLDKKGGDGAETKDKAATTIGTSGATSTPSASTIAPVAPASSHDKHSSRSMSSTNGTGTTSTGTALPPSSSNPAVAASGSSSSVSHQNTINGSTHSRHSSSGHAEDKRSSSTSSRASQPTRPPKRTRGSMSLESNSPSTTPPPVLPSNTKRRRI